MTDRDLELLRGNWARAVKIHDPERGNNPGMKPCWFRGGDYGPCEGWIEGAHWIKRQTVERWIAEQIPTECVCPECAGVGWWSDWNGEEGGGGDCGRCAGAGALAMPPEFQTEPPLLAAWDARNGIPACERHHRIFDSQRVPLPSGQIVVPRLLVPDHVEEFAADWGLEHELERKHPR